jgi:hypothetical protein
MFIPPSLIQLFDEYELVRKSMDFVVGFLQEHKTPVDVIQKIILEYYNE